ncbi:multiple C2 and transmembrane domain-containing protein 2 isoform X2 [Thalassophryne amazonica]|uniref:multiple C2 and transmembrane domain-containing protein 2 isoform X2 n=1 Tax=Thalassophryne amazonica TaxID=390379 RepID=UPI0014713AEC|nr:multiple C2 and transmembrane domain-containing protein 2 isoform X2 [Thalassophryne amazonica]
MDKKKKRLFRNFNLKARLNNLKIPNKKTPSKQRERLAYRRSLSVPDLTLLPGGEMYSDSALKTTGSEAIFFGTSFGQSETDSISSDSATQSFTDKPMDSVSDTKRKDLTSSSPASKNRRNLPDRQPSVSDEPDGVLDSDSESQMALNGEQLYAQAHERAYVMKEDPVRFTFDPIPAPRSIFTNIQTPKPDAAETFETPEETSSSLSPISAALARASSFGDQVNTSTEKNTFEEKKLVVQKRTQAIIREKCPTDRWSLPLDTTQPSVESGDESPSGTPIEEQIMAWTAELEDMECERFSRQIMDETLPDDVESEEVSSERCSLADDVQDPSESCGSTPGLDIQGLTTSQRFLLSINLKEGRNLAITRKRSGSSDPYVKFKFEGKQFYKSKVIYKTCSPQWNESFSYPLPDRDHAVEVRVFDKNLTADEFMGSTSISLKNLEMYKTYEMELTLENPKSKEDDSGVIIVDVCIMFRDTTLKRSPKWPQKKNKHNQVQAVAPTQRFSEIQRNQMKNQMWNGVLCVCLVEGQDMPQCSEGDLYVRFRLGDQKYKSKNLCIQASPQWREQFDFNHLQERQELLQVEVCAKRGRKSEESWGMIEIDPSRLRLNKKQFYNNVLNPGKGRLVFLVTPRPCWGVSLSDIQAAPLEQVEERNAVEEKFSLKNSYRSVKEVGFLQVKVIKASDLAAKDLYGKSDPFCVVELGNSKLQTQTIYKTLNPEWKKALTFPVKDIHDVLELTVFDENVDKPPVFLGKMAIPLLAIENGQEVCLSLKKEDLKHLCKGTITLELEVIYNQIRASVRTFQPKEIKFTEECPKFSKKILARNIARVRKLSTAVLHSLQYIKSCFQWESTQRSLIAFLIFLLTVWYWELFMLPLFLLLLIGWNYVHLSVWKTNYNQDQVNASMVDDDEDEEKQPGKKGLMDKFHMVQEVVLVVQNCLEEIANIGERIKNIFNWSVPFLSCMAFLVLFVATAVLYYIPLRYIVLIWGVNKFTKKLRSPYSIDNNKILDFLKRVPSDVEKVQYSTVKAPTSQILSRKKK